VSPQDELAQRLGRVQGRIEAAARAAGRATDSVRLIAVSKRKPVADIRAAHEAGCRDFGENYGQELLEKQAQLADLSDIRWHHIGHLQRNKVRQLVGKTALLHGVDSVRLLTELEKRAGAAQVVVDLLLQVNVSGEQSKSGCAPPELPALLDAVRGHEHLRAIGLMAMPPFVEAQQARPYFQRLRSLRDDHGGSDRLPELSMGMSHDFEVAIEEGATIVRVGTAIFGQRPPKPSA